MPKSLTKKFSRMVAADDASALLSALGPHVDPRDFHIQGDLLPLRCVSFGAAACFLALVKARTDLAEELCSIPDGNGGRAIDLFGSWATPEQAMELATLAPTACSQGSATGSSPLTRALARGLWASAREWLDLDPKAASLNASGKRGCLLLAAEPAYEIRSDEALALAWTPAPQSLIDILLAHGADPLATSEKGYSALSRSIASGSRRVFDAVLSRLPVADAPKYLARGNMAFAPLHEAVWNDRPDMLADLVARGAELDELTEKNFGALHLAILQNSKQCAQTLIDLGHRPDQNPRACTSSACCAVASAEPAQWIEWLRRRGVDLDARDDLGAHWLELAWEKLDYSLARNLWNKEPTKPVRSPKSLLGALERAARSKKDAAKKVMHLIESGCAPARIDPSKFKPFASTATPAEELSGLSTTHVHGTAFGVYKHIELGPMWATTEPGATSPRSLSFSQTIAFRSARDDDDEPKARPRPCLLAYAASLGQTPVVEALLDWGAPLAFWSDADHLCAWREALRVDANLPTLRALAKALSERSVDIWGPTERHLALARLGPAKTRELGAHFPSAGQALSRRLALDPSALPDVFRLHEWSKDGDHLRYTSQTLSTPSDVDLKPWQVALGSEHLGATKALLPMDCPMPAISCFHVALAATHFDKPDLALWAALRCRELAAHSDPLSPWGADPQNAIPLWESQMRHELDAALAANTAYQLQASSDAAEGWIEDGPHFDWPEGSSPASSALSLIPDGSVANALFPQLIGIDALNQARKLVEMGLCAPQDFEILANAIERSAASATTIGRGNDLIEPLRSLCDALCARGDFRAILHDCGDVPILARVPDPALVETFMKAGAPTSGSDPANNAFVVLCKKYAGRMGPSFAGHLAELSRENDPSTPLAVATALASMPYHNTRGELALEPTAALRLRLERATRGVTPGAWSASFEHGFCPVEAALEAGNVALGIDLALRAPPDYARLAGAGWGPLWLAARASTVHSALSIQHDAQSDQRAHSALDAVCEEMRVLEQLRVSLDCPTPEDAIKAWNGLSQCREPARALLWFVEQGWRPQFDLPVASSGYMLPMVLTRIFESEEHPVSAPLLAHVLAQKPSDTVGVELCLAWDRLGLPSRILGSGGKEISCHLLLAPSAASTYESRSLQGELVASVDSLSHPAKAPRRL